MIDPSPSFDWRRAFPDLARDADPRLDAVMRSARLVRLPANSQAFYDGARCESYLLLVSGRVRVQAPRSSGATSSATTASACPR